MKSPMRLLGRRLSAANTLVDHAVAVDHTFDQAGRLLVSPCFSNFASIVTTLSTSWAMKQAGASTSPMLLTRIEVYNPNASALTFRLALMTTPSGSPDTANAFLAWDVSVVAYGAWSWQGQVPLIDRYLYGKANGTGLVMRIETQGVTP